MVKKTKKGGRKTSAEVMRERRAMFKELGLVEKFRPEGFVIKRVTKKGKPVRKPRKIRVQKRVVGRMFGLGDAKEFVKMKKEQLATAKKRHAEALQRERAKIKELGLREVYRKRGMPTYRLTKEGRILKRKVPTGVRRRVVGRLF